MPWKAASSANSRTEAISRAGRLASGAALAVAALVTLLVLVPAVLGWQWHMAESGSSDRERLVLSELAAVPELQVGDVITYQPPPGASPDDLVTHRIAWTGRDGTGARTFRTKDDANATADPWTFRLGEPVQPRVRFEVPWSEQALVALGRSDVQIALLALPTLLVALLGVGRLRRQFGGRAGVPA